MEKIQEFEMKPECIEGESIMNEDNEENFLLYFAGYVDELLAEAEAEAVKRIDQEFQPNEEEKPDVTLMEPERFETQTKSEPFEVETKPETFEGEYYDGDNKEENLILYFAGYIDELLTEAIKRAEQEFGPKEEAKEEANLMEQEQFVSKPELNEGEYIGGENKERNLLLYFAGYTDELPADEKTEEKLEEKEEGLQIGEPEKKIKSSKWKMLKKGMKNFFCCFCCIKNPN